MWMKIDETAVRHKWECPECDTVTYIEPWFYSENGTPICVDCPDQELEYIHTEIYHLFQNRLW